MVASSVLAFVLIGAPTRFAPFCSVGELRDSPSYQWTVERGAAKVDSAPQVVRVQPIRADSVEHTITFEPLEWLRGAPASSGRRSAPEWSGGSHKRWRSAAETSAHI